MTFTPSEITLGAAVPLENGGAISLSIAGHVETERDYDDAVVIFGRKLLKYTNCATDADRLTVRQVISSITSTPLDKVPDVGKPTSPPPVKEPVKVAPPAPEPKKEPGAPKITKSSYDARQANAAAKQDTAPATPPSAEEQAAAAVARVVKLSAPVQKQVESFGICDKCGEAVPKSQAKLSQLFMSKTLCKACMDSPGGSA